MSNISISPTLLAIITVNVVVAVDMFGTSLVIPVMATFTQYLGATKSSMGLMYSVFSGCALLSTMYMPRISDYYGRRTTFLLAGFGAAICYTGTSFATSFPELICWRAMAGLFTGTIANAFAYIADVVPANERPTQMSYVSATISTCFIIGPMIGGGFAAMGIRVPFYAAACIAVIGFLMTFFFLKEPGDLQKKTDGDYESVPQSEPAKLKSTEETTYGAIVEAIEVEAEHIGRKLPFLKRRSTLDGDEKRPPLQSVATVRTSGVNSESAPVKGEVTYSSPYCNPTAMIVGGFGTFLNGCTFTAFAVLNPLLLMEPSWGIVKGVSVAADASRVSLMLGYILGMLGIVQTVCMIWLFPMMSKKLSLLQVGTLGSLLTGGSFCCLVAVKGIEQAIPVYLVFAVGNSLMRPMVPAYLGQIAEKGKNAQYLSISSTAQNLAMMVAAQFTILYSTSPHGAILLAGSLSILNSVLFMLVWIWKLSAAEKKDASKSQDVEMQSQRGTFFEKGLPLKDFWHEVEANLTEVIDEHNWSKALESKKGQILVMELLLSALPQLSDDWDERMETVFQLYKKTGHEDWAMGLAVKITSLRHHLGSVDIDIPGNC